jgi:uroporphyrinogen decarboxylase
MQQMTSHERFKRMYEHREADHIPIIDSPWGATIERWHGEGMPDDVSFADYFGLDRVASIWVDSSPRYEQRVIEETEDYRVTTTSWGVTYKNWKHAASTPQYLGFTVTDPDSWQDAKQRMTATPDRIPWDYLKDNYARWREGGSWVEMGLWFGFDVTHAHVVGTERLLVALAEDPDWCVDMFNHELDVDLALCQMIWDAGYHFDCVTWPDDMGYKYNQFFSLQTYRDLLKPAHKRAADWAHSKGVKVHLHSCGDIRPLVPELIGIGIDALNPLEVKAGMDPIELKRNYGSSLVLHGGINAVLWDEIDAIEAEMRRVVPVMKESGGYIFSSDHSVPSTVSLENFRRIVELAEEIGRYDC